MVGRISAATCTIFNYTSLVRVLTFFKIHIYRTIEVKTERDLRDYINARIALKQTIPFHNFDHSYSSSSYLPLSSLFFSLVLSLKWFLLLFH